MLIESSQNSKVKNVRLLYKDKQERLKQNVFLAEGVNLVQDAERVKELYFKASKAEKLSFLAEKFQIEPFLVKDEIFDAMADTKTPSGVIAVVEREKANSTPKGEIVLLLDGISDSGNLGTIIRTAAARGIQTIVCADCADAFSPKCVRAAMSGTFFVDILETNRENALELLKDYDIVGLDMGGESVFTYKRQGKIALTVGSEAKGLGREIREKAKQIIAIPMPGRMESLNAAMSIGIAMYIIH